MKTLYLACNMGAAGDMLSAALLELFPDPDAMLGRLNALGIPEVTFSAKREARCGIMGTRLSVAVGGVEEESLDLKQDCREHAEAWGAHGNHVHGGQGLAHDGQVHGGHGHGHPHVHRRLADIEKIVGGLDLPEKVRGDVMAVYRLVAHAESRAHGRPVEEVHFHEVGAMDAVADITAFSFLVHELSPEKIMASPVNVGFGEVECAHGILPVPAPATTYILQGVPIYAGQVRGELCTPTGAALLKHFAADFLPLPQMQISQVGIGCGKKEFAQANCVRAFLGETGGSEDQIVELSCNLDDMTAEAIGFAMEELMAAGALDAYTIPVTTKKSRPGFLLTCMCPLSRREEIVRLLFQHTTTLGLREITCNRYTMERAVQEIRTPVGVVRLKSSRGYGARREKYEHDDLARIARQQGISLAEAADLADAARDE